ncbi:MAG: alpha-galactosidase [Actinomycetales bacterium]|nr:alpha-galactosidase [Actinomycetales bacterium]
MPDVVHLRRGGTSLVLRLDPTMLPCVLHWGPDLGDVPEPGALAHALAMPYVDSPIASQSWVAVLPQHSSGWLGRPGLLGSRAGRAWSVAFDAVAHAVADAGTPEWPEGPAGAVRLRSVATDTPGELEVVVEVELLESGLLRVRAAVTNLADEPYEVLHLEPALPVPADAGELLDMAGRHTHERTPQRRAFDLGLWHREAWGGRPGHDSATVVCAGRPGFGWRAGRVWGVHVGWSGNQVVSAEHDETGWRLLRGGELLLPGEMRLARGETYCSPWLYGSWGEGLDEFSHRFHRFLRARPQHPARPRPVLLNTWEAVYFDMDLPKLLDLAERAADLGIERYVLDDGWFRHRRSDNAGLGDWFVDESVWGPEGLHPLVDRVRELGMEFGLWFEPEAINPDSDLARAHPEWVLQTNHGPGPDSRYQQVLDLGHPEAYAYVLERISALVAEYGIAYLKWDHNRALVDAGHTPSGRPGVHAQTVAFHRMLAELKARHPGLEIESCAGGGGRVDLGVIEHTDRIWVSDCIDAHERHRMVRWTGLTLPPELMGTHVGSGADHTTRRSHELAFRAGTAMWGHMGVEWDLTTAAPGDVEALREWVALHKEVRGLLHSGDVVHADLGNPVLELEGVVAADRREALYRLSALDHTLTWPPGRVTLPGLDPDVVYHVTAQPPGDAVTRGPWAPPWGEGGVRLTGRVLGEVGLQSPLLGVDQLVLLRARAVE